MIPVVVVLSAWVLWHDVSVYRDAESIRLGGPTYEVTSYETKAECEAARGVAMAIEARSRAHPSTERLSDGIKLWDPDRRYYTTLRYRCWPAGPAAAPFR